MASAEFIQEEFRLALAQPRVPPDVRRDAAMAFVALSDRRATLEAAEGRYDDAKDLEGLDDALRTFEAILATRAWVASSADRRADLGARASHIYHERYAVTGDERDLRRAISTSEAAVDAAASAMSAIGDFEQASTAVNELITSRLERQPAEDQRAALFAVMPAAHAETRQQVASCESAALAALGEGLVTAFDRRADREVIDRAVELLERARAVSERARLLPSSHVALHLAAAQLLRFKSYGARADADGAVTAAREAIDVAEARRTRAQALDGLGCSLLARSEITEEGVDLAEAIECFEEAMVLVPDSPWIRANLANGLSMRFKARGERADLTRAAKLIDEALDEVPRAAPDRARLAQASVAIRSMLERSPGAQTERELLLSATPAGARAEPARLGAMASQLLHEAEEQLNVDTLEEGVRTYRRAIDISTSGAVDRPSLLYGLGRALATRFALIGDDEDLGSALDALRSAVAAAGRGGPELPLFTVSLAVAASMLATRTQSTEDRRAATALFSEACAAGQELSAPIVVDAGEAWGRWAAEEGNWTEAAKAGLLAVAAAGRVYRVQIGRADRETSLMGTARVHRDAAIALVRAGMSDDALVTLERGRAQLVSDALDGDRAAIGALSPDLSDAYTAATARVLNAERSSHGTSAHEANAALENVIAKIRTLPGYAGFLRPMDLNRIALVARETPLVYVASGMLGAAVVAALPGGAVVTRMIDGVDDYVVSEHFERLRAAQGSRHIDIGAWKEALDDVGLWMGMTVWPAVRSVLGTATCAVVIQAGLMTLLPLQIAWSEDRSTVSGRLYALDEFELSFAPNARALESCRRLAERGEAMSVLTVGAPEHSGMAPLKYGASESAAVRAAFAAGDSLPGAVATRDRVLDALSQHGVLHFACHGRALPYEPLRSALLLAGDDVLTVRDLIEQKLPGARLAVLSACETAAVGTRLVDEAVGLPTGFLQAGVAGVIATSWDLDDESSALLVRRFFDEWSGDSPRAALRAAQQWVRDSTNGEKLAQYPDVARHPDPDLDAEGLEDWLTGLDHTDIEHWGGFIHVGA